MKQSEVKTNSPLKVKTPPVSFVKKSRAPSRKPMRVPKVVDTPEGTIEANSEEAAP